jgi:hypothetical protein
MELKTKCSTMSLKSIDHYIEDITNAQWPHMPKKVHFNTSGDAWESLPDFNQYIQKVPMKDLVQGIQHVTKTRKNIMHQSDASLSLVEIGNFLDSMFLSLQNEYTKRLDDTFLQKQYNKDSTCLERIKRLYTITPTVPICSFLVHKEIDVQKPRCTNINRALGYIDHIYNLTYLNNTDKQTLSLLNKQLFKTAIKNADTQTIIKARILCQPDSLVSYIKSLPKIDRKPLYQELANKKWRTFLDNTIYSINKSDKKFLTCHMDLLQEKYANVTALFKKTNTTENQPSIHYDHKGFCKLLQETITMDFHTIAGELLLHWSNNFSNPATLAPLMQMLEYEGIVTLIKEKMKQSPQSTLLYAAAMGILYANLCKPDEIYKEETCLPIISSKARPFLSKIEINHINSFTPQLWNKIVQAQYSIFTYLSKIAENNNNFADMFNYNAHLINWGFPEYKPMFKDFYNQDALTKMLQKNYVNTLDAIKNFFNTVENNVESMPALLLHLAVFYHNGYILKLYNNRKDKIVIVTIIERNEERAQSLYEAAARLHMPKAHVILANHAIEKNNIDEALKHCACFGNNIAAKLNIAELLIKKTQSICNAQEAKKYLQEAKNICNTLITIRNPTQIKFLSRIHALTTYYDIDEQDPECPYHIAQKLENIFQNINRDSMNYSKCINPAIDKILKQKALAIINTSARDERDCQLLSLFAYHNILRMRSQYLTNPITDYNQEVIAENMKFAAYAAKNGNYLGKYCVALCLYINSIGKNKPLPAAYFKNLYEVILLPHEWIRPVALHNLLDLAHEGNIIAQSICLLDDTLHIRDFLNSCVIRLDPETITTETASILIDIMTKERIDILDKLLKENSDNMHIKAFLYNMHYTMGSGILENPNSSKDDKKDGIIHLIKAFKLGEDFNKIMQGKENKETLTKVLIHIKDLCNIHVKDATQEYIPL